MKARKRFFLTIVSISIFTLMGSLFPGSGSIPAGRAFGEDLPDTGESNDILKNTPETMPKDYSDDEIDRMLEDIQELDDSSDTEGNEDAEKPDITDEDMALGDEIMKDPDRYYDDVKSVIWLEAHPWVVWYICSDYAWLEAHPRFAARIYLNYNFWNRYPKIAYIIVRNRPFLIRYPRITMVIYEHDGWFIEHPFVAREVYLNYVFFNRHPRFYNRYYRHHEWIHRHPGVARVAYANRTMYKKHPEYLGRAYDYRRYAVKHRIIREPHLKKMHGRIKDDAALRSRSKGKQREKYAPSGKNNRGDSHDRRDRSKMKNGGKSDKLIRRGEQYRPDREYRRGGEGAVNADKKRDSRGKSQQLIRRGEQYKPDREYKRGTVPAPDKKIINRGGSGKKGGPAPREGGNQQGNPQGDRGKGGGDKRR